MGKIVLARVDERLIHGQVMANLTKTAGATHLFIVDDATAEDEFMSMIFKGAGSRTGLKVEVYTIEDAIEEWNKSNYADKRVILLTKTIEVMYDLVKGGLRFDQLNLGGLAKKPDTTYVIKAVAINKEQGELLKELNEKYDIEVYFQTIPTNQKVSLKDGLKKIE